MYPVCFTLVFHVHSEIICYNDFSASVLHRSKSVLIIAVFYLAASQIYGDYGIKHVFFSADFIERVFNELSLFITRDPNGWGKKKMSIVECFYVFCMEWHCSGVFGGVFNLVCH